MKVCAECRAAMDEWTYAKPETVRAIKRSSPGTNWYDLVRQQHAIIRANCEKAKHATQ